MYWQYKKNNTGFWLVMAFFIMTGLAIIFYLNQYPNQPRERDYAYVGSFYAFAIWIGIGFMFVYEKLQKYLGEQGITGCYIYCSYGCSSCSDGCSELG